jgi:hypothetical protein
MNSEEFRAIYGQDPAPGTVFPEDQPRPAPAPGSGGGGSGMTPEEARAIYGDHPAPSYASPLKEPYQGGGPVVPNAPKWRDQSALALAENAAIPLKLPDLPGPLARIKDAAVEGWNSYNPESPADAEINQRTAYGKYLVHPLVQAASVPIRALGALGQGQGQAAYEGGNAVGGPRLGRDAYMLNQAVTALLPQGLAARVGMKPDFTPSTRPSTVMERMAPRPIEGQTNLGRAIDLLRHDTGWEKPETPGYLPPGVNPNQPGFVPPGAALPVTGPHPAGVPDTLLGKALEQQRPAPTPTPGPPVAPPEALGPVEYAKQISSGYFDIAHRNNATYSPEYMNKAFDVAKVVPGQTEHGIVTGGPTAVTSLLERWQGLRDKPATLQGATEMDRSLADLITQEYGPRGISGVGKQLQDIQRNLRDHFENPGAGDVTGGTAGIEAMAPARRAWSQALKMDDIVRMQERADRTQNPTQSIKTQANTLLSSRTKSRGWSPEEKAALEHMAERGTTGDALYGLGSRLLGKAGAVVGASIGGIPGMLAGYTIGEGGSALSRAGANRAGARRIQQMLDTLKQGLPPPPPGTP